MVQLWFFFMMRKQEGDSGGGSARNPWWVEGCPLDTPPGQPWALLDTHGVQ